MFAIVFKVVISVKDIYTIAVQCENYLCFLTMTSYRYCNSVFAYIHLLKKYKMSVRNY